MKCPECGAWSSVLATRKGKNNTLMRRRMCGNQHRFSTSENVVVYKKRGKK